MMCEQRDAVDVVDHRRQRRALAAAGRAGHEHEAALFVGDLAEHRRQQQVVDRQDLRGDDAQHHAHRPALLEDVDAEAAEPGDAVGEVDFLRLDELVALLGRHHLRAHRQRVFVHQPLFFADRDEHAGDARHRIGADLEVKVGRALRRRPHGGDRRCSYRGAQGPLIGRSAVACLAVFASAAAGSATVSRHVRQPAVRVGRLAVDGVEEPALNRFGDRARGGRCRP